MKKIAVSIHVSIYGRGTHTYMRLKSKMQTSHPEDVRSNVIEDFQDMGWKGIEIGEPTEAHTEYPERGMKFWNVKLSLKGKTRTYRGDVNVFAKTTGSAKKKATKNFARNGSDPFENMSVVVQTEDGALIEE